LIREAKLFSEKSSQENKIFIDCSTEISKGSGTDFLATQLYSAEMLGSGF
jgi:hypothetical protein